VERNPDVIDEHRYNTILTSKHNNWMMKLQAKRKWTLNSLIGSTDLTHANQMTYALIAG
jgi:hypothetical protein